MTEKGYVDVRELHPFWRRKTCWNCGNEWLERRTQRVCRECFMGQQQTDHDGEFVTDEGYTDYGALWYGPELSTEEYQRRHEAVYEDVKELTATDREVRI